MDESKIAFIGFCIGITFMEAKGRPISIDIMAEATNETLKRIGLKGVQITTEEADYVAKLLQPLLKRSM